MPVLLDDLQQQIANGQVVAIVGAGVSIGATIGATGADTASWVGLLKNGIKRCEGVGNPRPNPGWSDRQEAAVEDGQLDELLSVASQIESRLGAPNGGEYRRWLRESVGALRASDRAVLEALRDLGVPLATTNYDRLIEEVTELPAVTWRDGARIQRVIRGDEKGVLHLHGYWEQPESVVLGIRSYDQVLGDAHAQTVQSALALMKSFLFVGCGEGLADPNFGALLEWMQKVFPGAEYRHFRLCRDDEVEAIQAKHPPGERIFAVGYGPAHADLIPFLRRLKQQKAPQPARPETGAPAPLPPRPARIFGRDQLVEDLVMTLLLDTPPPIAVLGGAGFGKSTLCLAGLHDPRVAKRFGARRWFIRCDAANTAEDVLKEIALVLGLDVGPSLEPRILAALGEAPGVLVIDNAETPWWAAPLPTEELLSQLSRVSGLALIAAIRGQQRPYGPAWQDPSLSVTPLNSADSRKVFLAIAGEKHSADQHLSDLLGALDGIPLAIELLAHAAEAEPNLDGLWRRWQEERVALLRRADGSTRLVNAAVSFELSIAGPRMTDEARRLLGVLAVLPDGIAHQDLPAVMLAQPDRTAAILRQVGLAFDETGRLRVLAPIREHVAAAHPPSAEALGPALAHYTGLAEDLGDKVGRMGGEEALRRLASDARNVEAMLSAALASPDPERAIRATLSHAEFLRLSGLGTLDLLEKARQIASARGSTLQEAACARWLGLIALLRSNHDTARTHFEEAQLLYQTTDNVLGVANCIWGLGDIARERSDHDTARARYEEAQLLYQQVGSVLGEANCIRSLGDMAQARSDHDTARARFEEAQPLYHQLGDVLGVANCIKGLGDIALSRSDHDTARARFEEAQHLYRRVGNELGVANCIFGMGNIARERSDHDTAGALYEEAQPIYEKVGNVLGVANCITGLGDIALARSDNDTARAHYEEAQPLFRRADNIVGVANCIRGLGEIALARSDHDTSRAFYEGAQLLYEQIGHVLGVANCTNGLGEIALALSDHRTARIKFEKALRLYERIPDPYSIGNAHWYLARVAANETERAAHVAAAREAYQSIQRDDLIQRLDAAFGA